MKKFISLVLFVILSACMSNPTMSPQKSVESSISAEKPFGASELIDNETVNASYNVNASYDVNSSKVNQTIYSRKCCDAYNNVRCYLDNWTPVGDPCFCYYQGWGHSC